MLRPRVCGHPWGAPGCAKEHHGGVRLHTEKGNVYIMPYLLVRHKVEDYERWKPVFDHDHGATRKRSGSKGGWILRNADDPTELVILLEWDTSENARRFAGADETREAMQRAGVTDEPDVYFLEEVERLGA
jgi:heme-degrading monooxygenase HmoA